MFRKYWHNKTRFVALAIGIFCSSFLSAQTASQVDGGGDPGAGALLLTVDDTGGASPGWGASFNGVADVIEAATLSLADQTSGNVVYSGANGDPVDWSNLTAITDGPAVGDYATTFCKWDNTADGGSGIEVEQFTFADATSTSGYIIVVFKITATAAIANDLSPTLWVNFNVGGATSNTDDETEDLSAGGVPLIRHFDGAGSDQFGLALLSGTPQNVDYEMTFPASDAGEIIALFTDAGIDADIGAPGQEIFTAMTAPDISLPAIGDTAIIAFAICAGVTAGDVQQAATDADAAWNTDAGVAGWVGTLADVVNGTTAGSGLVINFGGFPGPVIDSISPSSGVMGGGDTLTIDGILLTNLTGVSFGGGTAIAPVVGGSDFSRTVVTPPQSPSGTVDLTFESSDGDTEVAGGFDYDPCTTAPTIVSVSPDEALIGSDVIITGTGFLCDVEANIEVRFGTLDANFNVDS
ncbi:MAG: IPT/TIG domain-containing protein, partial [Planctomycetes bacterium]|nr:IPT/TIG domain-containing protein [Planctomycetota bacterium]